MTLIQTAAVKTSGEDGRGEWGIRRGGYFASGIKGSHGAENIPGGSKKQHNEIR